MIAYTAHYRGSKRAATDLDMDKAAELARQSDGFVWVALRDPSEEELKICLVAREGQHIDPLEFCKFMDAKAPYFFVPRYVEVLDALPMTPTNKVQKFKLRERGNTSATWDRETAAPNWKPTRHR